MQRFDIQVQFDAPEQATMCKFVHPQFIDVSPNSLRQVEIKFIPYAQTAY